MKVNSILKSLTLGLAVFVAVGAFASNHGSLHVGEAVEINGQQLPAGDYQVRWEGSGPNVQLTFMHGTKEVAKSSAKEVALDQAPAYDAAVIDHTNGKAWVSQIQFAGKKKALALGESDRAAMSDSSK
jgi:hypothetical protein